MRYNVSTDTLVSTRALLINAAIERVEAEKRAGTLNDGKLRTIETFAKTAAHADAFTLGYLATHAVPMQEGILSHRRSNAMLNVYALSKILVTARGMNGGVVTGSIGDAMTLAGVIFALKEGIVEGKRIANYVNDYANRLIAGRTYSSGATQSSSSLRCLELFGIVRKAGGNTWKIADAAAFERMHEACSGIYDTTPIDDVSPVPAAPETAPAPEGWNTIDGECVVLDAAILALACDTASIMEVAHAALPAPSAMLALPAPAAKRARGKRAAKA